MTFGSGFTCGKCSFFHPPADRTTEVPPLRLGVALIEYQPWRQQFSPVPLLVEQSTGPRRCWRSICSIATIMKCRCLYERLLIECTRLGKKSKGVGSAKNK